MAPRHEVECPGRGGSGRWRVCGSKGNRTGDMCVSWRRQDESEQHETHGAPSVRPDSPAAAHHAAPLIQLSAVWASEMRRWRLIGSPRWRHSDRASGIVGGRECGNKKGWSYRSGTTASTLPVYTEKCDVTTEYPPPDQSQRSCSSHPPGN
ncbi:hypothetical protein O3P69_015268 [Scylla paramamosain]|uniref:Uncharacterized protein n=1 Tax=Scylla paramamosain TaxID=85552 RepID=A0AAW0T4R2_SCYPA